MMKKLAVLMLVFGLAPVAGAALSFNVTGTTATIDGIIDLPQTIYLFIGADAPITVSLGAAAPSMAGFSMDVPTAQGYGVPIPSMYTGGECWIMGAAAGEFYLTGLYLQGVGTAGTHVIGGWFDEVGGYGAIGTGILTPEPATVALLGLGGLLLRRRKK
jgi:hypothetical protein